MVPILAIGGGLWNPPPSSGLATPLRDYLLSLSPVGMWLQDETAGIVGADISGNGYHGTYTQAGTGTYTLNSGAITRRAQGNSVRYVNVGGVADRAGLFVPHAAPLSIVGAGSIVSWCHGTFGTWNGILSKINGTDGFALVARDGQNCSITTLNGGAMSQLEGLITVGTPTANLMIGRWGAGNASVWADGIKIAEQLGGWSNPGAVAVPLEIGSQSLYLLPCDELIAFTVLYNRALTDGEIAAAWAAS